jgi:hypothetical protein
LQDGSTTTAICTDGQKAGQTFERFLQQFYNELIAATCVETIDAVMACNSPASA